MNEVKPGCFQGNEAVCGKDSCDMADVCIWRRLPEEGGRGPLVPDRHVDSQVMEGGLPIGR